jgi:hypothetical protein
MLSGRRYLLGLSPEQEQMCEELGNIFRSVCNTALEKRREYRLRGAWMNDAQQRAELADAKRCQRSLRCPGGRSPGVQPGGRTRCRCHLVVSRPCNPR